VTVDAVTVGDVLDTVAERLAGANLPPARQEARDLIAALLGVPRFWPSAHRERPVSPAEREAIDAAADRLARGMPFAYAAGRASFRSLTLRVDQRVLIPRPETELLIDLVLAATGGGRGTAIDVGTGSGAIALALATEGTFDRLIATDVSADALAVAQENAADLAAASDAGARAAARVEFRLGSFLAPCSGDEAAVVVSNPPYICWSEADELPALVRDWEPPIALFAGDGGLAAIAATIAEAASVLVEGGLLAMEVDARRAGRASELAATHGAYRDVVVRPDLAGRARFVCARRG
jgi:release factor glutamine methyltransferase